MLQQETDNSEARPETSNTNDASHSIFLKPSSSTSTSATTPSWSRFKDPRVVRASKALGGKDRHSKVCTVRGLRDRRVRLSVPTAIQLYDLQERLGLNQPSKAVDWLLNAAKNEINELPPLQIPPGMINFGQNNNNQPILDFQEFRSDKQGLKIDRDENIWARNQEQRQFHQLDQNSSNAYNSSYNSNFRLDHSNLSLSNNPRMTGQHEDWYNNFGLLPFQPTLSTVVPSHHHHQVFVYHNQPETSTQSYFPSSELTVDSTNSQPLTRPVHFNMTANLLPSQDNNNGNR